MVPAPTRCASGDRRRRAAARRGDGGYSVIEMTVVLVIMAVVVALTCGMIVGLQSQQVNVNATVGGAHQAQLASQEVVQYLRATATPISATNAFEAAGAGYPSWFTGTYKETSTSLEMPVFAGIAANSSSSPNVDVLQVTYNGACQPNCPAGTGDLLISILGDTGKSHTIATYSVLAPSQPIFTYYSYAAGTGTIKAMPMPAGGITENCAFSQIVAVSIDLSFLATNGRKVPSGYAAQMATTLQTTVYLHNADDTFGSTTTTTPAPPGGCVT